MWRSRKSAEDVLKTRRFENVVLPHPSKDNRTTAGPLSLP